MPAPVAALCTLVAALRPSTSPAVYKGLLETLGGLWICALLLAPWVAHRLRPLRTCLAAARSVADALDVLAGPGPESGEWSGRRAKAYAALRSARVAYGLYRSGGFENQQRPARIIDAIGQVMDQAVALRSLLIDMERRSPPPQWQAEYRAAITAVAARLRRLGEAIETDAELPPADGTVSLGQLTRASDQARPQLAGQADPAAAALLLQVRRIIGRMNATTDSVSQILAHDPHLGREPGAGGWARFTEAVTTRSPRFRHAARVGTAMALTMALAIGLHLPHPHWLILTVLFSLRDSYADTVQMVLQQAAGTTVGAIVAAIALALAPERITLLALIFISGALGFTLKPVNTTYWIMFGTPMTMLLIDFTAPLDWTAALLRIALTLAGALLALVFARLLFPAGTRQLLAGRLARLLHTHAELARAVAARPECSGTSIRRTDQDAATAAATVEAALTRLARQAAPPQEQITRLREAGRSAQRVRDHLNALAALTAAPVAGPIATIARQVADYLDEGADAVLARHAPDTEPRRGLEWTTSASICRSCLIGVAPNPPAMPAPRRALPRDGHRTRWRAPETRCARWSPTPND